YGELVSSVPSRLPSSKNCTPPTATLSVAVAVRVTVPRRIELAGGPDQVAVGAVVSETAAVVNLLFALTVSFPAASLGRTGQLYVVLGARPLMVTLCAVTSAGLSVVVEP